MVYFNSNPLRLVSGGCPVFGGKFVDDNVDIPSQDLKADFGKEAWIGGSSLLYYFYLCIILVHTEQAE